MEQLDRVGGKAVPEGRGYMHTLTASGLRKEHNRQLTDTLLFNLYAEGNIRNTRLEELYAGVKTAGRNINNFRYAGDTTLMAERKEELNNLLMRVKEESDKACLRLNTKKKKLRS